MHLFALTVFVVQILFAINVVRRGHNLLWLLAIVLLPGVGCLLYAALVLLPEANRAPGRVARPGRAPPPPAERVPPVALPRPDTSSWDQVIAGKGDRRFDEARRLLAAGDASAAAAFEQAMAGSQSTDPKVLGDYAAALFRSGRFHDAHEALETLTREHPTFSDQDAHLLHARVLEALGRTAEALEAYPAVCRYYTGAEAKCRHALLLEREGRGEAARELFNDVLAGARHVDAAVLAANQEWIAIAQVHLEPDES